MKREQNKYKNNSKLPKEQRFNLIKIRRTLISFATISVLTAGLMGCVEPIQYRPLHTYKEYTATRKNPRTGDEQQLKDGVMGQKARVSEMERLGDPNAEQDRLGEETRAAVQLRKQYSDSIEKATGETQEDYIRNVKQKAGDEWWNKYGIEFLGICASAGFSVAAILAVSSESDAKNMTNITPIIKQKILDAILECVHIPTDPKLKTRLIGLVGEKKAKELENGSVTLQSILLELGINNPAEPAKSLNGVKVAQASPRTDGGGVPLNIVGMPRISMKDIQLLEDVRRTKLPRSGTFKSTPNTSVDAVVLKHTVEGVEYGGALITTIHLNFDPNQPQVNIGYSSFVALCPTKEKLSNGDERSLEELSKEYEQRTGQMMKYARTFAYPLPNRPMAIIGIVPLESPDAKITPYVTGKDGNPVPRPMAKIVVPLEDIKKMGGVEIFEIRE